MPAINVQLPDGAKSRLEKDETVLWAGETKPYPLISAQNRSRLFLRWGICAVIAIAFIAFLASRSRATFGLVAMTLIVVGFAAALPVLDRKRILKNAVYVVTDRRVIRSFREGRTFWMNRAGLHVKEVRSDEGTTFLFGAATSYPQRKFSSAVFFPPEKGEPPVTTGLVFYNVQNAAALAKLLGI